MEDRTLDVRQSDVGKSEHQTENSITRALILAGLKLKWIAGDAVAALSRTLARSRLDDADAGALPVSHQISHLTAYTPIIKPRAVAAPFSFTHPFYRCHDRSRGSLTTI